MEIRGESRGGCPVVVSTFCNSRILVPLLLQEQSLVPPAVWGRMKDEPSSACTPLAGGASWTLKMVLPPISLGKGSKWLVVDKCPNQHQWSQNKSSSRCRKAQNEGHEPVLKNQLTRTLQDDTRPGLLWGKMGHVCSIQAQDETQKP